MCGLFAVFSRQGVHDLERLLRRGAEVLKHRGPDAHGVYCSPDNSVGLAHRRLSVMAPHEGAQPLHNERRSIHAIVNGEFYDDQLLRKQLEKRSHHFATNSDSEILVHLYEEYGPDCLAHLRGEFAFVLWDAERRQLFAARDRFGVKPLLFHRSGSDQTILIASEAKAFFAAGVVASWDDGAFSFAASSQYLPSDRTLFAGIEMLPPGRFLLAGEDGVSIKSYWSIPEPGEECSVAHDDIVNACREHVEDAVQCRLRSDARVCYQLSGGLDSSSVSGIAARASSSPVDVFTIGFPESDYSEFDVAERTARSMKANLHKVNVSQPEMLAALADAVKASEGLSINGHVAAKFIMHRRMRDAGFKVVLTGEGADEAFFGYSHLRIDYWNLNGLNPPPQLAQRDQTSRGMMLPSGDSLQLSLVKKRLGFIPHWIAAKATLANKVHQLLRPDFLQSFDSESCVTELVAPYAGTVPSVTQARDSWTRLAMAGYILKTLGDGTEMPSSMEGRVPFLDHKLWEFLATVPLDSMFSLERDKPLLRDSVQGVVTAEVYQRPKHPFDAPPLAVFAGEAGQNFIRDHLRSDASRAQPFFCPDRVEARLDKLKQQQDDRQLWDPALMLVLSILFLQELVSGSNT